MHKLTLPSDAPRCAPENVLVYYDGPQLMWLPVPDQHLLALALPDDAGPWPFLVCRLRADAAPRVTLATLRNLVMGAEAWYVLRDYGAQELYLEPLDEVPEAWRPDAQ